MIKPTKACCLRIRRMKKMHPACPTCLASTRIRLLANRGCSQGRTRLLGLRTWYPWLFAAGQKSWRRSWTSLGEHWKEGAHRKSPSRVAWCILLYPPIFRRFERTALGAWLIVEMPIIPLPTYPSHALETSVANTPTGGVSCRLLNMAHWSEAINAQCAWPAAQQPFADQPCAFRIARDHLRTVSSFSWSYRCW